MNKTLLVLAVAGALTLLPGVNADHGVIAYLDGVVGDDPFSGTATYVMGSGSAQTWLFETNQYTCTAVGSWDLGFSGRCPLGLRLVIEGHAGHRFFPHGVDEYTAAVTTHRGVGSADITIVG